MIQFHKTPILVRKLYPSLVWEKPSDDEIFLTFDDGPHPDITPWVCDQLKKVNGKATFFCVGENIEKYEQTSRDAMAAGHVIANHTNNHLKGWSTRNKLYFDNVLLCDEKLRQFGMESKNLFRPPYGRISRSQIRELEKKYRIVMWSHLSWDFDKSLNRALAIRNLKKAGPGSIIVFHDSEKAFGNLQNILPEMLEFWISRGFRLSSL